MPGLKDTLGFFGTPTTDSERTMVTRDIKHLALVYYDFFGNDKLMGSLESAKEFLSLHCEASHITSEVVV